MKLIRFIILGVLVVAGAAASIPFVLPSDSAPEAFTSAAALTFFFSVLGLGAALLFALGLQGFKTAFKKAYAFLVIGLVIHALALLVIPIFVMYTPYFGTGVTNLAGDLPYLVGTVLIFIGLYHFAKLLEVRTWLTSPWLVVGLAGGLSFLSWALPHVTPGEPEVAFDLIHSILWLECIVTLQSVLLLAKVRQTASLIYSRALAWLLAALVCNLLAGTLYLSLDYFWLPVSAASQAMYEIVGAAYACCNLLFIAVGYSFNRITRAPAKQQKSGSALDVVAYVASLASQPKHIDPLLDPLRTLTAAYTTGQALRPKDRQKIAAIYQSLEDYLVTKEPLRTFSRPQVQQLIQHKFSVEAYRELFSAKAI